MGDRTIAQIIEVVRGLVQDQRDPFRYPNSTLCNHISEAVSEARRVRPDLFVETLLAPLPYYTQADLASTIPLPDMYFSAVCNFVAGRTQLSDHQFAADGRAVMLISAYGTALTGGSR